MVEYAGNNEVDINMVEYTGKIEVDSMMQTMWLIVPWHHWLEQ